eukprot:CAMPEP_0180154180 /NCGR_PEP_ID=MMETSP0986-20121125/24004_1 /TAXON_ID=697907 /ORGANISM="non described non described, Strain CCMP2293" /LENGTH=52 /DNA_ID=CAMNT_0022102483 /DNA_START=13 /DNA_END=171 /DNA_ORIENTATION=-
MFGHLSAAPKADLTMLLETMLHPPAGCGAVHGGQKPSARCWKAFQAHMQKED